MSKTVFFTDPHLGLTRVAHTTSASRALLRQHLYDTAMGVVNEAQELDASLFCLGDLFDLFSNKEPTIRQGATVAEACDLVLGGNHDQQNNTESYGSLELLKSLIDFEGSHTNIVLSPDRAQPYSSQHNDPDAFTTYYTVPHCMSQELFTQSLAQASAAAFADPNRKSLCQILLLHCNVGDPHEHDLRDAQTALWLTDEMQVKMLEAFDYILIGHEHVPQSLHDGRLLVLGNIYPIGFGEIADRFYYVYDSATRVIEAVKLADMEKEFREFTADEIMQLEGKIECAQSLIQITGTIKPADYPDFARSLSAFWKSNPALFAVNAHVESTAIARPEVEQASFVPRTLPDLVGESVRATPFAEAYAEIVEDTDENVLD